MIYIRGSSSHNRTLFSYLGEVDLFVQYASRYPRVKWCRAYFAMVRMADTAQQELELLVGGWSHFARTATGVV